MASVSVEGTDIDRCPKCGGIWLDALERDRLLAASSLAKAENPSKLQPAPHTRTMNCPRDHSMLIHMVDLHQPKVHYESCKLCGGMFFEAGELKDLSRYTLVERIVNLVRHGF
jgi:Zn-finger nucleic acid-binding protein